MSGSASIEFIPHGYQEKVIERMFRQFMLGQLLDPGLGKTAITLEAFRQMKAAFDVDQMLVVAPLRVAYSVWPREVRKWRQFKDLRLHVLHGPGKVPDALSADFDVLVINPEGLSWLVEHKDLLRADMLVADESTKFKRISSGRMKNLRQLLRGFGRRNILTGTPAPNGLIDLHGQQFILDRGQTFGVHLKEYREEYFAPVQGANGRITKWVPRRGCSKRIYDLLSPWVVRLDARDHLDLPEKVVVDLPIDLPPAARDQYARLRQDMVIQVQEGDVVAMGAAGLTSKCRQMANGSVYLNDLGDVIGGGASFKRRSAVIHTAKAEALTSIVEELQGHPLLVGFEHRHELPVIRKALQPTLHQSVPSIDGSTSATEGARLEREWNAGNLPVLCVHPLSAAHGLNLQEGGSRLFWYSIPWDLELYDQLIARVWRQGQTERTMIYRAVAHGTIDETVIRVIDRKSRDQQDLLDALKEDLCLL